MNAILAQAAARARDILIGSGIPLFGQPGRDVRLEHTRTHTFDKGFVRTAYSLPAS